MSKKVIVLVPVLVIVILGGGLFFKDKIIFLIKQAKQESISSVGEGKKEEVQVDLKEWRDPAGFAFLYPDGLQIDLMEEDEVNYAHLKLTKEDKKGKIEIICGDSQFTNLDDWAKKDKEAKEGSALETTIASVSAKRVALKDGKEIAGLIDADQVIYLFKKEPEGEDFWDKAFSIILSSFKLTPLEGESEADFQQWLGDFDTSGADIIEPVEIIE